MGGSITPSTEDVKKTTDRRSAGALEEHSRELGTRTPVIDAVLICMNPRTADTL
jgi:hypothetical protein